MDISQFLSSYNYITSNNMEGGRTICSNSHLDQTDIALGINRFLGDFRKNINFTKDFYYLSWGAAIVNDFQLDYWNLILLQRIFKRNLVNGQICSLANLKGLVGNSRAISSRLSNYLGFSESVENNIALDATDNYQATSKYHKKEGEPPLRIIWWKRILCALVFLITGIYCACNGIKQLLGSNKLYGWILLITGFLLGQLFGFTLRYGLFLNWF